MYYVLMQTYKVYNDDVDYCEPLEKETTHYAMDTITTDKSGYSTLYSGCPIIWKNYKLQPEIFSIQKIEGKKICNKPSLL